MTSLDQPRDDAAGRPPVLEVTDLTVEFFVDDQWIPAAQDVSYAVAPGEVLAIVGESGSGKTQSSMSLLGLLPPNGRARGSAKLNGREVLGLRGSAQRKVRGKEIAVIFQEPMTALNPVYPIGFQIVEALRSHFSMSPSAARERALELLRLVEIPEPERRFDAFPHQLSGGQRQRAMIAQALSCEPTLLVADEPTTALDVTVQAEILKLITDLKDRIDSGIVIITHDMGVVADMADRMIVMKDGRVVERGATTDVFTRPQHPYTQQLLAAVPHFGRHTSTVVTEKDRTVVDGVALGAPVLELEDLVLEYPKRGSQPVFRAVDGVSFSIAKGEVVGLVGESGSGKTTIGRAAVGLLPVAGGSLRVDGVDMASARKRDLADLRRRVGIVFQDPGSSLNPRIPVGESIGEPLRLHTGVRGTELSRRVEALLDQVHLPRAMRNRYPHELSGGQRQRVGIARALALEPQLLVADEPTSALDVSVQARVLDLFQELQREYGFGCLFISHDLAVVEMLASRIAVMHHGKLVELGTSAQICTAPREAYTQRLVAAVPVPDPAEQRARRERRDALLEAQEPAS
ncbi:ABC transporter ATP-binding protein [Nocardioides sp. ChNu-153]|uniref:ABC transporter ATP-binding protein n=1 Tax=unclassified Nocardioides TaxID=2615069 RepID=UPI0024071519|nr:MULTISPECIES: ABC transporter ATP-binding protein [unclassified Nocardioides]MDF9716910.1 ABC transporter ATP-binding protein [Nocardioides sp. ChNu-99]MDN7122622.1 ABC transporter ATP-binding protein [Nocardioides sp. ChNu-153]